MKNGEKGREGGREKRRGGKGGKRWREGKEREWKKGEQQGKEKGENVKEREGREREKRKERKGKWGEMKGRKEKKSLMEIILNMEWKSKQANRLGCRVTRGVMGAASTPKNISKTTNEEPPLSPPMTSL